MNAAKFLLLGSPLLGFVKATPILLTHSFFSLANTIDWVDFLPQDSCYHPGFQRLSSSYLYLALSLIWQT